MKREELTELHYITPIDNMPSICVRGILSHNRAEKVGHKSVAMPEIQERRSKRVVIPGGRPLHDYVNLYFDARNPMMFKRKGEHDYLCVLSISIDALDLPGVVVTDGNASSDYTRFVQAPSGLGIINAELVFAEYWTSSDPIEQWRRKSAKCSEVLVPDRVPASYILRVYVSGVAGRDRMTATLASVPETKEIIQNGHLFFQ